MSEMDKRLNQEELKILEERLLAYFINNKYFVENKYVYSSLRRKKTELTDGEKNRLNYLVADIVNNKSRESILTQGIVNDIVQNFMKKPELYRKALWLAIKYEPISKKYEEDEYRSNVKKITKILSINQEVCFHFVARNGFLNKNLEVLEQMFLLFDSQLQKETLLELCINNRLFKNLNGKTICYKILESQIINKNKYIDFFPEFKNENVDILKDVSSYKSIYLYFSLSEINKLNIKKSYLSDKIFSNFQWFISSTKPDIMVNLNLTDLSLNQNNDYLILRAESVNLNEKRIQEYFFNCIQELFKRDNFLEYNETKEFANNMLIITDKLLLDKLLPTKETKKIIPKL